MNAERLECWHIEQQKNCRLHWSLRTPKPSQRCNITYEGLTLHLRLTLFWLIFLIELNRICFERALKCASVV